MYSILLLLPPFFCHFLSCFWIIHGEFPVLFFSRSLVFETHACGLETAQSVLIDFPLSILQFVVVVVPFQFNSFHLMDVISQPSSLGNCLYFLLCPPFDLFVSHSNVYSRVTILTSPCLFIPISHLYLFVFYSLCSFFLASLIPSSLRRSELSFLVLVPLLCYPSFYMLCHFLFISSFFSRLLQYFR